MRRHWWQMMYLFIPNWSICPKHLTTCVETRSKKCVNVSWTTPSKFFRLERLLDRIDVKLWVRKRYLKIFATSKGVRQGDAPIPILFVPYLSNTLLAGIFISPDERDHDCGNPGSRFSDDPSFFCNHSSICWRYRINWSRSWKTGPQDV